MQVVVVKKDVEQSRVVLSTKVLERTPGDMLRDRAGVFAAAETTIKATAENFKQQVGL